MQAAGTHVAAQHTAFLFGLLYGIFIVFLAAAVVALRERR